MSSASKKHHKSGDYFKELYVMFQSASIILLFFKIPVVYLKVKLCGTNLRKKISIKKQKQQKGFIAGMMTGRCCQEFG